MNRGSSVCPTLAISGWPEAGTLDRPFFRLTALYAWIRLKLTMCLKFQLTKTTS